MIIMSESIFPLSGKGIPKELTLCLLCTFLQKNEQITLLSTCKEGQQELRKTRLLSIDPIVQMKTISMTCDELMEKFLQLVGREKGRLCLWNKIHNLETHPQVLYLLQHGYISSIFLSSLQQPLVDLLQHVSEVRLLNCPEVHDLTSLQGKTEKLHLQNMPNIRNISMLRQVRELSLKHMKQKLDIRSLYNLEKLSLINSHHVEGLTHLPRLQELSLINETQQYIRTNSNVDNGHYDLNIIFMLAHLRSLSLDGLRSLEHLPSLPKTLQKIQINFCNQLHDIAAVAHVPNIHITCCSKIVDVSVLANIKRLPLDNCCSDLHRRSVYHQLSEVYISRTSLTDVSPLAGVHKLTLFDCPLLTDVRPLAELHFLQLHACSGIQDVCALGHVQTLKLLWCSGIQTYCSALGRNQDWELYPSGCLELDGFKDLRSLTIIGYAESELDLKPLASLKHVELRSCSKLHDISGLKCVSKVSLVHCRAIRDVSALSEAKEVFISKCKNISQESLIALANVPKLNYIPAQEGKIDKWKQFEALQLI